MIPKFKAYDLKEEQWIEIKAINYIDGDFICITAYDDDIPYFADNLCKTWELLQSTGLFDKNGKEIFDGDIVKHDPVPNPFISNAYFEIIQARSGEWRMDNYRGGQVLAYGNHEVEVVGNKFENPELLEEE